MKISNAKDSANLPYFCTAGDLVLLAENHRQCHLISLSKREIVSKFLNLNGKVFCGLALLLVFSFFPFRQEIGFSPEAAFCVCTLFPGSILNGNEIP